MRTKGFSIALQRRGFCVGLPRRYDSARLELLSYLLLELGAEQVDMGAAPLLCGAFGVTFYDPDEVKRTDAELLAIIERSISLAMRAPRALVKLADRVRWHDRDDYNDSHRQHKHRERIGLAAGIQALTKSGAPAGQQEVLR